MNMKQSTMKTMNKIQRQHATAMPDGTKVLSFLILNCAGHRIGKVSGDLNSESEFSITARAKIKAGLPIREDEYKPILPYVLQ